MKAIIINGKTIAFSDKGLKDALDEFWLLQSNPDLDYILAKTKDLGDYWIFGIGMPDMIKMVEKGDKEILSLYLLAKGYIHEAPNWEYKSETLNSMIKSITYKK